MRWCILKLTLKQKRFVDEYIISGNATEAAIIAGYSKKYANTNASKLLQNTTIKEHLNERLKDLEDKSIAKQEEVLKYLTAVMRGENQSETVVIEAQENGTTRARRFGRLPEEKDRLKAAELLGKRYGTWTDRVEVDADMTLSVEVDYGAEDTE